MGEAQICKRYKKVAYSHTGPKEAIFTRLRCKQWDCPFCAKKNASIWREFLKEKLPEVSKEWYLVTFTAHSKTRSKQASLQNIRGNIDTLFKRVRRVFGRVSYVRTFERHPRSQAIHAHFIVSGITPYVAIGCSEKLRPVAFGCLTRKGRNGTWSVKTWFKISAQDVGIGMICDVRLIEGEVERAVLYVCKYLTKSQQELGIKGLRHVQTSRDIGSPKEEKSLGWQVAAFIVPQMFPTNAAILDLNTGEIIDNNYWEKHGFYPYED